jgi:hypothetical protein
MAMNKRFDAQSSCHVQSRTALDKPDAAADLDRRRMPPTQHRELTQYLATHCTSTDGNGLPRSILEHFCRNPTGFYRNRSAGLSTFLDPSMTHRDWRSMIAGITTITSCRIPLPVSFEKAAIQGNLMAYSLKRPRFSCRKAVRWARGPMWWNCSVQADICCCRFRQSLELLEGCWYWPYCSVRSRPHARRAISNGRAPMFLNCPESMTIV